MNIPLRQPPPQLPFLKWAGGKRWLMQSQLSLFDVQYDRYIEPFLGSGAAFFALTPKNAILSDCNAQLINTYAAIRDDWASVTRHLNYHDRMHSSKYYYALRQRLCRTPSTKAAQFIYLNRTCWNGLYRVNLRGEFNVPIGTKTSVTLSSDNFEQVAKLLSGAVLRIGDFEATITDAGEGDFLFVDPPYTVKHNTNGFVKYNESLFSWDDQIRLRNSVQKAIDRGAKALITNAAHESIRSLYRGFGQCFTLDRPSVIAAGPEYRGRFKEMVIKCY